MDEAGEVESYSSAAVERHLDAIDNTFVDHLLRLCARTKFSIAQGWGLDVGTGPAQIPVKILLRIPELRMAGIDRSRAMLAQARQNARLAGVSARLALAVADGHSLPFADGTFSLVLCNSVLHHARQPMELLREMARVARPEAVLLLRDLRRPPRPALAWHLWRHGRHYRGLMRKLFEDSVRAAYTLDELEDFIRRSKLQDLAVYRFGGAHIGIERTPKR